MATSKLYPTLSKFYEGKHIDFGSELDIFHSGAADHRWNRKECRRDSACKILSLTNNDKKGQLGHRSSTETEALSLYPRLPENNPEHPVIQHKNSQKHELCNNEQTVPSAPPVELMEDEILRFIENALIDQNMGSSLDDTPAVDYSTLTYSSDDTWTDDLMPDYDVTSEEIETDFLNNLDKTDMKTAKDKLLDLKTGLSVNLNIIPEGKKSHFSNSNHSGKHRNVSGKSEQRETQAMNRLDHVQDKKVIVQERSNRTTPAENSKIVRPTPESLEYNAWMTWRKQVNRQLATTILLRQGADVKLHKNDLSRKHLNQKSVDFVSNVVKPGNKTSLGGKPFLMYGIPRASLSGGQGS